MRIDYRQVFMNQPQEISLTYGHQGMPISCNGRSNWDAIRSGLLSMYSDQLSYQVLKPPKDIEAILTKGMHLDIINEKPLVPAYEVAETV